MGTGEWLLSRRDVHPVTTAGTNVTVMREFILNLNILRMVLEILIKGLFCFLTMHEKRIWLIIGIYYFSKKILIKNIQSQEAIVTNAITSSLPSSLADTRKIDMVFQENRFRCLCKLKFRNLD